VRQEWEPEDLIEVWTLLEEDQERLRNKSGANRLGFALLLKFFEVEARFPEDAGEIPVPAVSYVAQQVKVPAEEWATYDWSGRAIKRHRMEIRGAFGFRECTEEDQGQLAEWLAVELCGVELNRERLAEAELTALADHLTAHGLVLEMLAGPLPGIHDPTGPGKLLFAFFAAMAETERENIRESTLEGLDTAARKGKHGGRPPVITDDMLHTVLRRRAGGESVEQIQPDLIIPTGKRKGQNPSVASIYRALAEHAKRGAYPEAVEQAHADFAALHAGEVPGPRPAIPDRASL